MARRNRRPLYTCKNCETEILPEDSFCKNCGQENHDHHLTMKAMLYEFVEGITHFDNKVVSTYKNLIFKPGKLTKEFIEGKRVRYVPPVRLYIFTAFVYFLLMGLMVTKITDTINSVRPDSFNELYNTSTLIDVTKSGIRDFKVQNNDSEVLSFLKQKLISKRDSLKALPAENIDLEYRKNLNKSIAFCDPKFINSIKVVETSRDSLKLDLLGVSAYTESAGKITNLSDIDSAYLEKYQAFKIVLLHKSVYDTVFTNDNLTVTRDVLQKVYSDPVKIDSLIASKNLNFLIAKKSKAQILVSGKMFYGNSKEKDLFIEEIGHKFTKYSSFAMYFMMPVSALLLWLFFYRKEKLYFPHFLFSMHIQTANFIFLVITVGLILLFQSLNLSPWFSRIAIFILFLLLVVYFYKAIRLFYENSKMKTLWKLLLISALYLILLGGLIYGILLMAFFN